MALIAGMMLVWVMTVVVSGVRLCVVNLSFVGRFGVVAMVLSNGMMWFRMMWLRMVRLHMVRLHMVWLRVMWLHVLLACRMVLMRVIHVQSSANLSMLTLSTMLANWSVKA